MLAALEHRHQSRILSRLDRASASDVQHQADAKLAEMLLWCKQRVPYYRQFLAGVSQQVIEQSPAKLLADLPVLGKADLHEHFEALTADRKPGVRVRRNATGGSTGETAQFLQDASYRRWNRALLAHFESWTGYRSGQSKITLWGIPRDVDSAARPAVRLRDRLLNRATLNAYNLSDATMAEYAQRLQRNPPALLRVFTQSGAEFAQYLRRNDISLHVGAVTSSGAMLLDQYRQDMTEAFGASVYDSYGSREVGPVAAEFEPGAGLLVSPATHRLEILRDDGTPAGPGEEGEIHVTLLINHVMPLLRYRIGDRGTWATNPAPSNTPAWQRLGRLVGRTMEHVIAADGTKRNSAVMTELVMHIEWIQRFQWVQSARDRIELRVVPHAGHPVGDELEQLDNGITTDIHRIIGPDCQLDLTLCNEITASPSGKYHYVVCKVR